MNDVQTFETIEPAATVRGLEVRSIAKAYDGRAVLHDVSLSVSRGEVVYERGALVEQYGRAECVTRPQ